MSGFWRYLRVQLSPRNLSLVDWIVIIAILLILRGLMQEPVVGH